MTQKTASNIFDQTILSAAGLRSAVQKDEQRDTMASWDPAFCGDIDMRIARDGSWHYMGSPIKRRALVRLFARVLRREEDAYFLVTPVEKVGISVEDAPFVATLVRQRVNGKHPEIEFTTNVGDSIIAGINHPIEVWLDAETEQPAPYVMVRNNLWALIARQTFYQLVEWAELVPRDGVSELLLESSGQIFQLGEIVG